MLKIGLTGNIGSGKTTVSAVFSALGIPVFHTDQVSKKFLEDPSVIRELVSRFGSGILKPDQSICRKTLALLVFGNTEQIQFLNAILHPRIMAQFRNWVSVQKSSYVIQEAAIIFESGIAAEFDRIIHVSCPEEIAINRVVIRDGVDGNSVLQRLKNQLPDEEKCALADFVLVNDGTKMVLPQVLEIHKELLQICP